MVSILNCYCFNLQLRSFEVQTGDHCYFRIRNRLFQKVSTAPLWTTLNWVLKNFRISKNDSSRFRRILNLADSKYWGIPEFCKTFDDFHGIPVKIHKILVKFMDFQSSLLSIFYRISNVVHRGCVDIFWNSPIHYQVEFFN